MYLQFQASIFFQGIKKNNIFSDHSLGFSCVYNFLQIPLAYAKLRKKGYYCFNALSKILFIKSLS